VNRCQYEFYSTQSVSAKNAGVKVKLSPYVFIQTFSECHDLRK
jgi:hypothetical protein